MTKNKTSLKAWQLFFMIIGMISTTFFLLLVIFVIAIILIKPWGVDVIQTGTVLLDPPTESTGYDHPLLSPTQEALLESAGVDVTSLPTQITPAMQECAVQALGETRAFELLNGATPSVADITQALPCFE